MNQVSCHKSLIRNFSSLTKHPVVCEPSSDPAMICDKHLGHSLFSSLPDPSTSQVTPSARVLQQKPGPQFFYFDKTLFICEGRSDVMAICDKILALAVFSFPNPSPSWSAPFRQILQQKPGPQFFFFDNTLVICERPSDPTTICDKSLVLAFFFLPQPLTIPKSPRSAGCCNKSLVRSFSLVPFPSVRAVGPLRPARSALRKTRNATAILSTLDVASLPAWPQKFPDASRLARTNSRLLTQRNHTRER